MDFRYKGRTADGKVTEGSVSAQDRAAALTQLQQAGVLVSQLTAGGGSPFSFASASRSAASRSTASSSTAPGAAVASTARSSFSLSKEFDFGFLRQLGGGGKVTVGELSTFCAQFSTLIAAGVPLLQILELMAQQFRGRRLATILSSVAAGVRSGNGLSQSMGRFRGVLPESLIYISAVSEMTGQLENGFKLLAAQFEQEDGVARKVKSAMTYPTVVLSVAGVVIIFMLTYVLPNYTAMFAQMGAQLPTPTRILMATGDFVRTRWYLLVPVPFLIAWGWRRAMKQDRVREVWQQFLLKVPVIKQIVYKREFGRLCRTLGTMVGSGVPLLSGLGMSREAMEFFPIARALGDIQEQVSGGESFGNALRRHKLFDHISVEMIALGEASGNLETMLLRVSEMSEKDLTGLLERATALMEPAMTLVLGVIVLGIIVPILLPMFDIFSQIR